MRRIKQVEENIDGLIECASGLITMYKKLQKEDTTIYNLIRESNDTLRKELTAIRIEHNNRLNSLECQLQNATNSLKKLSTELAESNVRIGRLENPPKFKEGDNVEYVTPKELLEMVCLPKPTKKFSGTIMSWYYKHPSDIFVTYKILSTDKTDVYGIMETNLKLSEKKEEKKAKK
ncbi:MAG: hypothetical protein WC325_12280 [Candidatus Bathyarchaeia archaeon]|jgi:hypothetical protein